MRAQADAEVALAMARENKTRTEAQSLVDKVRAARGPIPTSAQQSPVGQ
jgi:1,2-phenylacetyl-CoA epoxidase PaaB subunit